MSAVNKKAPKKADDEAALLEKIAAMPEPHRTIGQRLHELIKRAVPELRPRLFYGMPAYAKDGPVLCFFRSDPQYMTFGLTEHAHHARVEGASDQLMPSAWFFTGLDEATETRIAAIVRQAAS